MTTSTATATGMPAVRPYESYVYAYPHKTAYRPLPERPALRELWAAEPKSALSSTSTYRSARSAAASATSSPGSARPRS